MASFLSRFFKARGSRTNIATLPYTSSIGIAGQVVYPDFSFEAIVRQGYRLNELVYACITASASTGAFVTLKVYNKHTHDEIEDHPLRQLFQRPNDYMTESDFWGFTITNQKLAGRAYWQKQYDRGGRVASLWPIRPDYLKPIRGDGTHFLPGYRFDINGKGDPDVPIIPSSAIMDFTLYDPLDIYNSMSPIKAAFKHIDVDNSATDYLKLFWERGTEVSGIYTTKDRLVEADVAAIKRRISERNGGYSKWMQPLILDNGATYQKLGTDFSNMGFSDLDARSETRIAMVLGVPPILIGSSFGLSRATLSNYDTSIKAWWQNTLIPQYKRFSDQVNKDLLDDFDGRDEIYTKFDFDEVQVLQEDRTARWTRATAAFTAGVVTRNDARREMGLDEVQDGDVFANSAAVMLTPAEELPEGDADPDAAVVVTDNGQSTGKTKTKPQAAPVPPASNPAAPAKTINGLNTQAGSTPNLAANVGTKAADPFDSIPEPTADDFERARKRLIALGYEIPELDNRSEQRYTSLNSKA